MRPVVFMSDLHLHASRPDITQIFLEYLDGPARDIHALYILGDLFEFWIGDDDTRDDYRDVINHLRKLSSRGIPVYFMRGNRDFLVGDVFLQQTGCTLLDDPMTIDLFGNRVLLMHGDTLCTDDADYQSFRKEVRSEQWQARVLSMPIQERISYFQSLRESSNKSIKDKPEELMDVNQQAVEDAMNLAEVHMLIHGHTHRPGTHEFRLNNHPARRIVLGDWYTQGSLLVCDESDCKLVETRGSFPA